MAFDKTGFRTSFGSYRGTGAARRISLNLQGKADLVIISGDSTVNAIYRTSLQSGCSTMRSSASDTSDITSLNEDGSMSMTTGTGANSSGVMYHWVAFKKNPGSFDFDVFQYTGNGTSQTISNLDLGGRTPGFVMIKANSSSFNARFRDSLDATTTSHTIGTTADESDAITALGGNGFSVGANTAVNTNAVVHNGFAFVDTAQNIFEVQSWSGNSTDNRDISTFGFDPILMFCKDATTTTRQCIGRLKTFLSDSTTNWGNFSAPSSNTDRLQNFITGGVNLGASNEANGTGSTYHAPSFGMNTPRIPNKTDGRDLALLNIKTRNSLKPVSMNLAGLEFSDTTFPGSEGTNFFRGDQADFDYIASKLGTGTVVRVPFRWERAQPTLSAALDSTYMGYIDTMLTYAGNAGVKVLLDVHNYGGYYTGGSLQKIGGGTITQAQYVDFLGRLATRYIANANLWGYDIMNEPNNMPVGTTSGNYNTTSSWYTYGQAGIDAVRAVDTTHYLVVCTDHYSGVANFFNTYGANPTPWWTDSANKMYYSCHYYFDSDHSGTYTGANLKYTGTGLNLRAHGDYLEDLLAWGDANSVKFFIGEIGVPSNDPQWNIALNDFYQVACNHATCIPSYWAMGAEYSSITTISPKSSYTVDRAQMVVVDKYRGTMN